MSDIHRRSPTKMADMEMSSSDVKSETTNPLNDSESQRGPSKAFLASYRAAQEDARRQSEAAYGQERNSYMQSQLDRRSVTAGWKTKTVILLLTLAGVIMFITGGSIWWSGDYGEKGDKTGKDILLCSLIPLVPGLFGCWLWFGASQGWRGYSLIPISYD